MRILRECRNDQQGKKILRFKRIFAIFAMPQMWKTDGRELMCKDLKNINQRQPFYQSIALQTTVGIALTLALFTVVIFLLPDAIDQAFQCRP